MNTVALIIFSKAPVPGKVKTRLIPDIGVDKATSTYKELLSYTLSLAEKTHFSSIQLWIDGDINHPFFKSIKNQGSIEFKKQSGIDLGQRMSNAFDVALDEHDIVIVIGCDCPTLTVSDLKEASGLLIDGVDVVLGPAEDGGYYLIGLKENNPHLFEGISWGKESVMAETCRRINELNWRFDSLSERWDLDRPADLLRYSKLKKGKIEC